jgi:hypothetical protein
MFRNYFVGLFAKSKRPHSMRLARISSRKVKFN